MGETKASGWVLNVPAVARSAVRKKVRKDLRTLSVNTGFPTGLAILEGHDAIYVSCVLDSRQYDAEPDIEPDVRRGMRLPAYCTAAGKVLLAYQSDKTVGPILADGRLEPTGPHTITSREKILKELQRIRDQGYAIDNQERTRGVVAIAAPVRDAKGQVVAAVDVSASVTRKTARELVEVFEPYLVLIADRISARFGYQGPSIEDAGDPEFLSEPWVAPTMADLGKAIRELRRARRKTMRELTFAADLHYTTLSPIEREKRAPKWDTLCALADALNLTAADVVRHAEEIARARNRSAR